MAGLISITLTKLRPKIGNMVRRVKFSNERVMILCNGKPAAALVPMSDYEGLEEADAKSLGYKEYQMAEQLQRWGDLKSYIKRERDRDGQE